MCIQPIRHLTFARIRIALTVELTELLAKSSPKVLNSAAELQLKLRLKLVLGRLLAPN
jgi:hypothetical protein